MQDWSLKFHILIMTRDFTDLSKQNWLVENLLLSESLITGPRDLSWFELQFCPLCVAGGGKKETVETSNSGESAERE